MRALVTGGAGYIGFSLIRALAQSDETEQIVVFDNLERRNYAVFVSGSHGRAPVEFRRADVLDGVALDQALVGVDTVFHLAGHATVPEADAESHRFDQINNWGTAQLARAIEKCETVHTVVHASSFAVYGHQPDPICDTTAPTPVSAYGVSKLAAEAHLRRLTRPRVHIVRAANVFGFNPAIRFDAVVNAMAFDACTQGRVRITGDGSQRRPFIEVNDLARALHSLAISDVPSGTFNLATHNASVNEIAETLDGLTPDLDRIHTNRDVRMQNVEMQLPVAVGRWIELPDHSFDASITALTAALRP